MPELQKGCSIRPRVCSLSRLADEVPGLRRVAERPSEEGSCVGRVTGMCELSCGRAAGMCSSRPQVLGISARGELGMVLSSTTAAVSMLSVSICRAVRSQQANTLLVPAQEDCQQASM